MCEYCGDKKMVSLNGTDNRCLDTCLNGKIAVKACSCDVNLGRFDGYQNPNVVSYCEGLGKVTVPNVCAVAGKCEPIKKCISNPTIEANHLVTGNACLCGVKECGVGNTCAFTAGTSDKYLCKCSTDA